MSTHNRGHIDRLDNEAPASQWGWAKAVAEGEVSRIDHSGVTTTASLRMPLSLKADLDAFRDHSGLSFNAAVSQLLQGAIERLQEEVSTQTANEMETRRMQILQEMVGDVAPKMERNQEAKA